MSRRKKQTEPALTETSPLEGSESINTTDQSKPKTSRKKSAKRTTKTKVDSVTENLSSDLVARSSDQLLSSVAEMLERLDQQDRLLKPILEMQSDPLDERKHNEAKLAGLAKQISDAGEHSKKLEFDINMVVELLMEQGETLTLLTAFDTKSAADKESANNDLTISGFDRVQELEAKVDELTQAVQTSTKAWQTSTDRTATIEEMVQTVLSQLTSQRESLELLAELEPAATGIDAKANDQLIKSSAKLALEVASISKREANLEQLVTSAMSKLEKQLENQEETLTLIADSIPSGENPTVSFDDSRLILQLDELTSRMEQLTTRTIKYEEIMLSTMDLLMDQTKRIKNGFLGVHQQLNERPADPGSFNQSSSSKVSRNGESHINQYPSSNNNRSSSNGSTKPQKEESSWLAQKAGILAQYGVAQEEIVEQLDVSVEIEESLKPEIEETEVENPADQQSREHEVIAQLRTDLESKLRKAEIEISIERAKIARMQSELECKKSEIESEMQKLEEMNARQAKNPEKTKILSRLSRWLPHKNRD